MADLESQFAGQPVRFLYLLAENASAGIPSESDAAAWEATYAFGADASALLDGAHEGYNVLFPDGDGYHGTAVLARGSVVSSI